MIGKRSLFLASLGIVGWCISAEAAPERNDATEATQQSNAAVKAELPFENSGDFELVERG